MKTLKPIIAIILVIASILWARMLMPSKVETLQKELVATEKVIKKLESDIKLNETMKETYAEKARSFMEEVAVERADFQNIKDRLKLEGVEVADTPTDYVDEEELESGWDADCNANGMNVWLDECITTEEFDKRIKALEVADHV